MSRLSSLNKMERRAPYSPQVEAAQRVPRTQEITTHILQVSQFSPSAKLLLHQYKHSNQFKNTGNNWED